MTDQPSYGAAQTAPDQAYADESARVSSPSSEPAATEQAAFADHAYVAAPVIRANGRDVADESEGTDGPAGAAGGPRVAGDESMGDLRSERAGSDPDGGIGEPAADRTGVPEVDALLTVLDDLDVLPIEDHAQVFAEAHQRLHETLLSADEE